MNRVKWGVLGCARIANSSVIPAILKDENSVLYGIASRSSDKLELFKGRHNPEHTYSSYIELLNDPNIDAVYIPLPNSEHYEWTIEACKRKKHVLCEKPLSLNYEQSKKMVECAKENGVLLMEAFMYRYTDRTKKVLEVINSKILGDLKYIYGTFRFFLNRVGTIKEDISLGGGSLYDVGSYPVNFLSLITDQYPEEIKSTMYIPNGVDVCFAGTLKYPDGLIAQISSGFNAFGRTYVEIIGDKGILKVPEPFSDLPGEITVETENGVKSISIKESDRYFLEVSNFSRVILRKGGDLLSIGDSLKNSQIIDQLFNS